MPKTKTAIITCSAANVARLLGCTGYHLSKLESAGSLRHSRFWKERGVANARGFMRDYWATYDVRHYHVADLISLLPDNSTMRADLKQLQSQFGRRLKAGRIELTSWGMPYIGAAITPDGKTMRGEWYRRAPKRPQTLPHSSAA